MSGARHRVVPTLTEVLDAAEISQVSASEDLSALEATAGPDLGSDVAPGHVDAFLDDALDPASSAWADSEILERTDDASSSAAMIAESAPWPDLGIGSAEALVPSADPDLSHPVIGAGVRWPKPPAASEVLMQRLELRLTSLVDGLIDELLAEQAQARLREHLEQVIQQWVAELSLQLAPVLEQRLQQLLKDTLDAPSR